MIYKLIFLLLSCNIILADIVIQGSGFISGSGLLKTDIGNPSKITTNTATWVFAGGVTNFNTPTFSIDGNGVSGRTYLERNETARLRKPGSIYAVSFNVNTTGTITNALKVKIFRKVSQYDYISSSEFITPVAGSNYVVLANPPYCGEGDLIGLYVPGQASGTQLSLNVQSDTSTVGVIWLTGDSNSSNQTPVAGTNNVSLMMKVWMDAPVIAYVGDSLTAAHNLGSGWFSFLDSASSYISGQIEACYQYRIYTNTTFTKVSYCTYAKGGQTFDWCDTIAMNFVTNDNPKVLWLLCGGNDAGQGRNWAQTLASLNSIRAKWPQNNPFFLSEVLPNNNLTDTQAATVRQWNINIVAWASTNNVNVIAAHDSMAQTRVTTGQLDDIKASYTTDGAHWTDAGVSNYTRIVYNALGGILLP